MSLMPANSIFISRHEFDSGFAIDRTSGLLVAVASRAGENWRIRPIAVAVCAEFDGVEARDARGGLAYEATTSARLPILRDARPSIRHLGTSVEYEFVADIDETPITWVYALHPTSPSLEMRARLGGYPGNPRLLRGLNLEISVTDPRAPEWRINLPGNPVRRNVPLREIGPAAVAVSSMGGLRGSSGLILATDQDNRTLVVWPDNEAEITTITVRNHPGNTLGIGVQTQLAADLSSGTAVDCRLIAVDVIDGDLTEAIRRWPTWASRRSLISPTGKPSWMHGASIYEVQIGESLFRGGHSYAPYRTIADVTLDLDRITALGFAVLQLMPRQPYPSYNVHDYFDIDQSYGDRDEIVELVEACHARGVRVILDVLLHGVIDRESIANAADAVRAGPFAGRLDSDPGDVHGADLITGDRYAIAWSRHILDFEQVWKDGAPERALLESEHPEWFFRDSDGHVTGVYTKAFDARQASWRRYFRDAMVFLLENLDVDGFRFDAPTYNIFANWAEWSRDRASSSSLACVPLFEDLRRDLKRIRPDCLMYTEPSGHLLRKSMDLNYNYDEQWLVGALVLPNEQPPRGVAHARQFLEWMQDRDAFLPAGSETAHHIDSHDTFWWPAWGRKWRREQFGVDATRALAASFMSLDGPFMMFTGGETGIEQLLTAMNALRSDAENYWHTPASYTAHRPDGLPDSVLSVLRFGASRTLTIFVNLSATDDAPIPTPAAKGRVEFAQGDLRVGSEPREHSNVLGPWGILLVSSPHSSREEFGDIEGIDQSTEPRDAPPSMVKVDPVM